MPHAQREGTFQRAAAPDNTYKCPLGPEALYGAKLRYPSDSVRLCEKTYAGTHNYVRVDSGSLTV